MNFTNIKLTQNQQLIVNACLSIIGSAFVTGAQAAYQYLTQHGLINIQQILLIFVGALWLSMSAAFVVYVPAHIQQELEALRDFQQQVFARPQIVAPVAQTPPVAPVVSPVTIHINGASTPTVTSAPPVDVPVPATPVQERANIVPRAQPVATIAPLAATTQSVTTQSYQPPVAPVQPQATPDDLLGDLPQSPATLPDRITGVMPVYGASGK